MHSTTVSFVTGREPHWSRVQPDLPNLTIFQEEQTEEINGMAESPVESVWGGLSFSENADASLLDELELLYSTEELNEDQVKRESNKSIASEDEPQRQKRLRKHRESMARLRQDRRDRIKILEKQELALQHKLHKALKWMDLHRKNHEAKQCQRLEYSDLVQAAESLMGQKYALEEELIRRQRFAKLVPRLEDDSGLRKVDRDADSTNKGAPESENGFWLRLQNDEAPFFYEKESLASCKIAIDAGRDAISSTRQRLLHPDSDIVVTHCLGWKVERVLDDHIFHFRFTHRVSRVQISVDELLDKTWTIVQSPEQLAVLCESTVATKLVQKVSNDASIQLRSASKRGSLRQLRHFDLITRMRAQDGSSDAIVVLVLDKQPRQSKLEGIHCSDAVDPIDWLNYGVASLQFANVPDDTIEIEYVGSAECTDQDQAAHSTIEYCASLVRWEQIVVLSQRLIY